MRHLSARRLITLTAALTAWWSCAPEPTCTGEWCGTVVVITVAEADVLLPVVAQGDVGVGIGDLLFLKLADVGPSLRTVGDSGFVPFLAESWRYLDPLTLEFTLHPEARWHDGTPVTAADVAFTFDVYRDTLIASIAAQRLTRITSVEARDERTVVFRFSETYPEQFFDAVYHMRILPRHLLVDVPRTEIASHPMGREPVGNGPFRFVRWRAGESIELVADSTFFLGRPGIRRVLWRFTADPGTALTQLVAGEADVLNYLGGPDNVRRVEDAPGLRVIEYPSAVYSYVAFNFRDPNDLDAPHPLFADHDVRRALTMAVDREAIVRAVLGEYGVVPPGPVSPALWIWDDALHGLPFDSAEARRLLARRGWTDTDGDGVLDRQGRRFAFEFLVPISSAPRRQSAQIIQEQLRRIGVEVRITELDFNAFLDQAQSRHFDVAFGSYGGDISPASIAEVWGSGAVGSFNWGQYVSPAVDRMLVAAGNASSLADAQSRWHEAVRAIVEDAPAIWVYAPLTAAGVHTRFENVTIRPDQWASTLWTWRVSPANYIDRDRYVN
jgi:peptide/nickel transport system substrate-binding protein